MFSFSPPLPSTLLCSSFGELLKGERCTSVGIFLFTISISYFYCLDGLSVNVITFLPFLIYYKEQFDSFK